MPSKISIVPYYYHRFHAVADELNLMSGGYSQSGAIDIEGNLNIQVSGEVDVNLSSAASIKANNLFFSAYTIYNQADITIADSATFDIRNKFLNGFYQGVHQRKGGNIRADNFNVTAVGNFSNQYYATINANDFNVVAGGDFTNLFSNISANNFNVVAGGDFSNSDTDYGSIRLSTISANNFNVVAGGSFYNHILAIIKANDFSVTVDNFFNTHNLGDGDITADTFNLSVAGDFDYASDYLNNGNIDATHQSFIARNGDFTNNTSIDLVGNLGITADNFINTNGNITADTFNLYVVVILIMWMILELSLHLIFMWWVILILLVSDGIIKITCTKVKRISNNDYCSANDFTLF